jgi:L-lactate dehydrogenase complex protein LldG
MSNARNKILASIRQNLAKSVPFDAVHRQNHSAVQSADVLIEEKSFVENAPIVESVSPPLGLVENFRENLNAIGGNVVLVNNLNKAAAEIEKIIENSKAKRIAFSDGELVGQTKKLLKSDCEIIYKASAAELFDCDVGITDAQLAISETGTLVLESEKEFNRLSSLVPPIHICLLKTAKIRRTLGETLETLEKDLSRTITFITGPSRTSDIELTLAIGVHGPAELYVILISEK